MRKVAGSTLGRSLTQRFGTHVRVRSYFFWSLRTLFTKCVTHSHWKFPEINWDLAFAWKHRKTGFNKQKVWMRNMRSCVALWSLILYTSPKRCCGHRTSGGPGKQRWCGVRLKNHAPSQRAWLFVISMAWHCLRELGSFFDSSLLWREPQCEAFRWRAWMEWLEKFITAMQQHSMG